MLQEAVEKNLSLEESAVLLALDCRLSLENPALLQFVGKEKSQVYELKKTALVKMRSLLGHENFAQNVRAVAAEYMIDCIKIRLGLEKRAKPFLKAVDTYGKRMP